MNIFILVIFVPREYVGALDEILFNEDNNIVEVISEYKKSCQYYWQFSGGIFSTARMFSAYCASVFL